MTKAKVADKSPSIEDLEKDKKYFWCSCGLSHSQPYCDGSHKNVEGFEPLCFTADASGKKALCRCKQTKNPPYCDGSHNAL